MKNKFVPYLFLFLSIILLFSYYLTQYYHNKQHTPESEFASLSERIDYQSVKLLGELGEVTNSVKLSSNNYWQKLDSVLQGSTYFCFVTHNDSVLYWNSNKLALDDFGGIITDNNIHAVNLPSGWYLYAGTKYDDKIILLLELIKTDFLVSNDLLTPGFNPAFSTCHDMELTLETDKADYIIFAPNNRVLLGANFDEMGTAYDGDNYIIFILFLFSYIFLVLFLYQIIIRSELYKKSPPLGLLLLILIVIIIRFFDIYFVFPFELKSSLLFSNKIFDVPLVGSAGNLIINTALLIIFSVAVFRYSRKIKLPPSPSWVILLYTALWLYIMLFVFVLSQLIYDQNIVYFAESIFNNKELLVTVLIIIGLNISLYYVIVSFLGSPQDKRIPFFVPFIISFVGIFIVYIISNISFFVFASTLVITFILLILKRFIWAYFNDIFLSHLFLLVLLAGLSSVVISNSATLKNIDHQKFIAQSLAVTNDSVFEESYINFIKDIRDDGVLKQMLTTDSADVVLTEYVRVKYLKQFQNKYGIQITVCGENELLEIQPEGDLYDCADYFNSLIEEITIPVVDSSLFRFNSGTESIYYISKIELPVTDSSVISRKIFIEFVSSHVPEGLGYPELLIDKRSSVLDLSEYSFAKYTNNRLTYKFGDFAYNTYFSTPQYFRIDSFYDYDDYRHFAVHISADSYLIVSKEKTRMTMKIVVFSVIFILLVLISIFVYLATYGRRAFYLFRLNFKTRLQTFVITALTITFVLMAASTLVYIEDSSKEELEKQLTEKTNSVLIELQHKLSSVISFSGQDSAFLHQLLRKFSLVFFSDINLYDKSGRLIATSRPEIFEKNLLSEYINPKAYEAIFFDNKLNYITEESVGSLKYYSAYVPINLNNEYPIGIVNLPYFARQAEFTKSYYIMLSYLINIYVIIGIIGALIAVIFSRYLTRPLVLLQESLASMTIDKHNEKIQWNKKDEIGGLINEYNLMVDKLEQSTYLLKNSERESAWREIALQIAHEIKNPLTPMKLNIQYLEKSFKNNDPDFDTKINSISQSLIKQIDALNNVAEMFSNFAKTRFSEFEKVDLNNIITSSISLFDKNGDSSISIEYINDDGLFTFGFEKDILRAINNILKNAIQSIGDGKDGEIKIVAKSDSGFVTVEISDNGKGISEEMRSKIFQPYFTTKSSGTGLGLAIVKNIMNEIGGKVSFESDTKSGTTFYLVFPEPS